jgi:hypothetical protein
MLTDHIQINSNQQNIASAGGRGFFYAHTGPIAADCSFLPALQKGYLN